MNKVIIAVQPSENPLEEFVSATLEVDGEQFLLETLSDVNGYGKFAEFVTALDIDAFRQRWNNKAPLLNAELVMADSATKLYTECKAAEA